MLQLTPLIFLIACTTHPVAVVLPETAQSPTSAVTERPDEQIPAPPAPVNSSSAEPIAASDENEGDFSNDQTPQDAYPGDPFPKPWVDPGFKKFLWVSSPNFGRRPDTAIVDTVVVHATVIPTLEKTAYAFYLKSSQVSSHFVIGRDGSIVQCVSTFNRAWHAGKSRDSRGYDNVNDYSIGVELVNLDDGKDPYPKAQVEALKALIRVLKRRFPLTQITSHEYIALPYGRKQDPAGFPWKDLNDLGLTVIHEGHAPLTSTPIPNR